MSTRTRNGITSVTSTFDFKTAVIRSIVMIHGTDWKYVSKQQISSWIKSNFNKNVDSIFVADIAKMLKKGVKEKWLIKRNGA